MVSIVNTIRDANLFGGIDQILKLTDEIDDTSKDAEYDLMEFFTSKVRLPFWWKQLKMLLTNLMINLKIHKL